jgi:ketosteroid isomerase-like protein
MDSPAVTLIRQAYQAMSEGRLDRIAEQVPPNFEVVGSGIPGPFIGPEGIARWHAELADAWETMRTDIEEVVDLGDRVVVLGRNRNRGRGSGIEVDVVAAHLWTIADGVPVRIELIGDREEALRRGHAESSG